MVSTVYKDFQSPPVVAAWLNDVNNFVYGNVANVMVFGAKGDGITDDTMAIQSAIATGKNVYLPQGTYNISQTLTLNNQHMFGDGQNTTFINCSNSNTGAVIVTLGALAFVHDLFLQFMNTNGTSIVTGSETSGQRVAFLCDGGTYQLQRGGGVARVKVGECGTAFFNSTNSATSIFSCHFYDIECQNFSYAGFEFLSPARTGNIYQNLYLNSAKWPSITYAFCLAGEESECRIDQINIESMSCIQGMFLSGVRAASIGALHFEECVLNTADSGLLQWRNSAGEISALTVYYCNINVQDWAIIKLGDATYTGASANPNTCDWLRIGMLHCKGLNDGNGAVNPGLAALTYTMYFIDRNAGANGFLYVQIDSYVWNTFENDAAQYIAFQSDPQVNISQIASAAGPVNWGKQIQQYNGFVHRQDGLTECWGQTNVPSGAVFVQALPYQYKQYILSVDVSSVDSTYSVDYRVSWSPYDLVHINLVHTAPSTVTVSWKTLGI